MQGEANDEQEHTFLQGVVDGSSEVDVEQIS